jgi:hypothetical protein
MVDFLRPQCKPCMALITVVENLEKAYTGKFKVGKICGTENRMLCANLGFQGYLHFSFIEMEMRLKDCLQLKSHKKT